MCNFNIRISDTFKYDPLYKHQYKKALALHNMIRMSEEFVDEFFDLPEQINVLIRPIRKANALYYYMEKKLEIDPRSSNNLGCLMATLCHELKHAEQYNQGRLFHDGVVAYWNGNKINSKGTTYKAYRKLPWEIEAFACQEELATKITNKINEKCLVK